MDLRIPIGFLFVVLGALLAGYGLVTHANAQGDWRNSANIVWGALMLLFGALMWVSARWSRLRRIP